MLSHALGLDEHYEFPSRPTARSRVSRREDGGLGVVSVNETGHHRVDAGESREAPNLDVG